MSPVPQEFALEAPLRITDTTLRDTLKLQAESRMPAQGLESIAQDMDQVGFHSADVCDGATFDLATRVLFDDPWERIRTLKQRMPRTPLQMLLRGQYLVGNKIYPEDVVEAFVKYAAESGIEIFRLYDALNDERNLAATVRAVKAAGKQVQLALCYSTTEERGLCGPFYTLDYFLEKAIALEEMGAESICIQDWEGRLSPYDAQVLIAALKARVRVPVQLQTNHTSGMAAMTVLKAAEAGVDLVDACLLSHHLETLPPDVEPLVTSLRGTPRDTGLDLKKLIKMDDCLETMASSLSPHTANGYLAGFDPRSRRHRIPGGMLSDLRTQLQEAGAADRMPDVLEELPHTRKELGYPPLVTPMSQIVGMQAVSNVLRGRWKVVSSQVQDYVYGLYGRPPAPMDPDVVKQALEGYTREGSGTSPGPADEIAPEMNKAREETRGLAQDMGDVLTYALYPVTGMRFLKVKYGKESPPDQAMAQSAVVQPEAVPPAPSPRARTFNIFLGGRSFQVMVDPVDGTSPRLPSRPEPRPTSAIQARPRPAAPPAITPQPSVAGPKPSANGEEAVLTAPMPGVVLRYTVEVGQEVKAGQTAVVLEAMKMENALPAPADGIVKRLCTGPGAKVARGTNLVTIGPAVGPPE